MQPMPIMKPFMQHFGTTQPMQHCGTMHPMQHLVDQCNHNQLRLSKQ